MKDRLASLEIQLLSLFLMLVDYGCSSLYMHYPRNLNKTSSSTFFPVQYIIIKDNKL